MLRLDADHELAAAEGVVEGRHVVAAAQQGVVEGLLVGDQLLGLSQGHLRHLALCLVLAVSLDDHLITKVLLN